MKKIIPLLIFFGITLINLVNANLNQEQINEAARQIQIKCPEYSLDAIKPFVIEQDCPPDTVQGAAYFKCGDEVDHKYECRQGIHYLDSEVISILSSKTEINTAQTYGDNSPAVIGDNNQVAIKNNPWYVNFFWSQGTIGGLLIGGIISLIVGIILFEYKRRRTKQKHKKRE